MDLSWSRRLIPALSGGRGRPPIFLDGPGGTQVPGAVVRAMADYLVFANANSGGPFATSRATDDAIGRARQAMGLLLGAGPDEISFGANSTTLCFLLALAVGRDLRPGERVVITDMDHEANRAPWLALREREIEVVSAPVDPGTGVWDAGALLDLIDSRTRVVAFGLASNATGAINDPAPVLERARQLGALTVVDAVHSVPHLVTDVAALGADFLFCSAYKFFGPHVGVLYGRRQAVAALSSYRVGPQAETGPQKLETGTLNHEGLAGIPAAVEFIASLGGWEGPALDRAAVVAGMEALASYEDLLLQPLLDGLAAIPAITLRGPGRDGPRTPTVAFTVDGLSPERVVGLLAERHIYAWDGHFYAATLVEQMGLAGAGGLIRMGLAPYNTRQELEQVLEVLEEICRGPTGRQAERRSGEGGW